MTLLHVILQKAKSQESLARKYSSPPPEVDESIITPKKKHFHKYGHVVSIVDSSPPRLQPAAMYRHLPEWRRRIYATNAANMQLLTRIKTAYFMRGRVDSHWRALPQPSLQHYRTRVDFLKRVHRDNKKLYTIIANTNSRVPTAASLRREWARNKREIVARAQRPFLLFPPVPVETIEDDAFKLPDDVVRPRVYLTLRVRGGGVVGALAAELFTDVCPLTCRLFQELLDGDQHQYGYVGTCFFRKVPGLFWGGGDVVHNNGFGCYAQRGRPAPIGAENYHFSHSMPGLLSMRVTRDDEMCGIFNITFKPLPQFDLKSVVFGRIIRPCATYDMIRTLGAPLSAQPVVEVAATRRRLDGGWVHGKPNTRLTQRTSSLRRTVSHE